jgi:hypothetical protein
MQRSRMISYIFEPHLYLNTRLYPNMHTQNLIKIPVTVMELICVYIVSIKLLSHACTSDLYSYYCALVLIKHSVCHSI